MEQGVRRSHYVVEELRAARNVITAGGDGNWPTSPNNPIAKFNAYVNPENPGYGVLPVLRIVGDEIEQKKADEKDWTKVKGTVVLGKAQGIKRETVGGKERSYLHLRDEENEYRIPAVAIIAVGTDR